MKKTAAAKPKATLDAAAKARVRAALDAGQRADESIAVLASPLELHQFVLAYNVNDGVAPVLAVVKHAKCDAGTALRTFWQYGEVIGDAEALGEARAAGRDFAPVLATVQKRLAKKDFTTSDIRFDPKPELDKFPGGTEELRSYGVRNECLRAVGHLEIVRDPL